MMQSKADLEKSHETPDQWGYKTNPSDMLRKTKIIAASMLTGPHKRALDLGACEGWITKDLYALEKFGYEISDNAAARFPEGVIREQNPNGKYDLIVATGVLYEHYDVDSLLKIINEHASDTIVTCNIAEWETKKICQINAEQVFSSMFLYESCGNKYTQRLRVFKK